METDRQRELFVRYVLGESGEAETTQAEEMFFADPEALLELQSVCDDLTDEYLRGEMSAEVRTRFEERLCTVPYLRRKVRTDRVLLELFDRRHRQAQSRLQPRRQQTLSRFPALSVFRSQALLAGGIVAVLSVALWFLVRPDQTLTPDQQTQLEASSTRIPSPTTSSGSVLSAEGSQTTPQSSPKSVSSPSADTALSQQEALSRKDALAVSISFLLSADRMRGSDATPVLKLPPAATALRLQVELTDDRSRRYRAVLRTGAGKTIRNWDNVRLRYWKKTPLVLVELPVTLLAETEYVLSLTTGSPAEAGSPQYRFRIEKP